MPEEARIREKQDSRVQGEKCKSAEVRRQKFRKLKEQKPKV